MPKWNEHISAGCHGGLPGEVLEGLELFNLGHYFEAHEALETAWRNESDPQRELYRGILQVAVVYLHITNHNYPGAIKVYQRCRKWLQPWPDNCLGIEVGKLRQDLENIISDLQKLGVERINEFDLSSLQPVRFDSTRVE